MIARRADLRLPVPLLRHGHRSDPPDDRGRTVRLRGVRRRAAPRPVPDRHHLQGLRASTAPTRAPRARLERGSARALEQRQPTATPASASLRGGDGGVHDRDRRDHLEPSSSPSCDRPVRTSACVRRCARRRRIRPTAPAGCRSGGRSGRSPTATGRTGRSSGRRCSRPRRHLARRCLPEAAADGRRAAPTLAPRRATGRGVTAGRSGATGPSPGSPRPSRSSCARRAATSGLSSSAATGVGRLGGSPARVRREAEDRLADRRRSTADSGSDRLAAIGSGSGSTSATSSGSGSASATTAPAPARPRHELRLGLDLGDELRLGLAGSPGCSSGAAIGLGRRPRTRRRPPRRRRARPMIRLSARPRRRRAPARPRAGSGSGSSRRPAGRSSGTAARLEALARPARATSPARPRRAPSRRRVPAFDRGGWPSARLGDERLGLRPRTRPPARPPARRPTGSASGSARRRARSSAGSDSASAGSLGSVAVARRSHRSPATLDMGPLPFPPRRSIMSDCGPRLQAQAALDVVVGHRRRVGGGGRAGRGLKEAARRSARSSVPATGAHVRQRPASSFQQFRQVYWRQPMQKLNDSWKASSCAAAS